MTPATMVDGNEIEGTFCLTFDDYNATDSEMENALEALLTITSVDLECGAVDNKLVLIYSGTPTYSSASSMANVTLDDGNELGGRFKLEYNRMGPTGWIDYDATTSVLTSALEQLGTIPSAVRLGLPARRPVISLPATTATHHYPTPPPTPPHPHSRIRPP